MKKKIVVEGMDTFIMGSAIARILESMVGVERIKLNLEEGSVLIKYDSDSISEEDLCDAVNEEGFEVLELIDENE